VDTRATVALSVLLAFARVENASPVEAAGTPEAALSVVVPVRERPEEIAACVAAVRTAAASAPAAVEIVVVDDASRDGTPQVIEGLGVRFVRLERASGAGAARNAGVAASCAPLLLFVDSDVRLHADAIARVLDRFAEAPDVAAWFGSYDDAPSAPGLVSQYRNLLHHYTHQQAAHEATTFWAGCGAVRRAAFEAVGGFDEEQVLEDVELGLRLRAAGLRIRVDPALQGTHDKRWTLRSMVATDVLQRALPWARLALRGEGFADDLNVSRRQRLAVLATGVAGLSALGAPWSGWAAGTALTALGLVIVLNAPWLHFLARRRGIAFALASLPLQLLHHAYSGASFAWAWLEHTLTGGAAR